MKKSLLLLIVLCFSTMLFAQVKLTFPVGGEKFVAGSDTLITWEGNVPSDTLFLEYSLDGGTTWSMLADKPLGNSFLWQDIPNITNANPTMRLIRRSEIYLKEDEPYIEWSKTYGGAKWDNLFDICELPGGNFVALGGTESNGNLLADSNEMDIKNSYGDLDIWLLKIDPNGNNIFSSNYGGHEKDISNSLDITTDNNLIISGVTHSDDYDFSESIQSLTKKYLMKLDTMGNKIWVQTYVTTEYEKPMNVIETDDGGFLALVDTAGLNNLPRQTYRLIKTDRDGNFLWATLPDPHTPYNTTIIEKTKDGGYIIAGHADIPVDGVYNAYTDKIYGFLQKLDSDLNVEWTEYYNTSDDIACRFDAVTELDDGCFIAHAHIAPLELGGRTNYSLVDDIWDIKVDSKGKLLRSKIYGGTAHDFISWRNNSLLKSDSGYIFVASTNSTDGDISNNYGESDAWLVKIDENGEIKWDRNYGGSNGDALSVVQRTSDHGYILAGGSRSDDIDIPENKGDTDGWILKLSVKYQDIDTLLVPFSIVAPELVACDVDMGVVFLTQHRDSTVTDFVHNTGAYGSRVDSIYIRGQHAQAFSLIGGIPKYYVEAGAGHFAEFRFEPYFVGQHRAEIVIITQSDTLVQNIIGEGIKKYPGITAEIEDFETIICTQTTDAELKIKNPGGDTLKISEMKFTGTNAADFSFAKAIPIIIPEEDSLMIIITFAPQTPGDKTANLEIISNAEPEGKIILPITARKDSISLIIEPTSIDLGKLFPNQTKDTLFKIASFGTIPTYGKAELTDNLSCEQATFVLNENDSQNFNFSFTGIDAEGSFSEEITIIDTICGYSQTVIITGQIVSAELIGFMETQCKNYANEYKLKLNNPSSNHLQITDVTFDKYADIFTIDKSQLPFMIEPYAIDYEIAVNFQSPTANNFTTSIKCITDNEFLPFLVCDIAVEVVEYSRTSSGLIDGELHTENNPHPVSYDTASTYGNRHFVYSIEINDSENEMTALTLYDEIEVVINYESNVLAADFDSHLGMIKVRMGNALLQAGTYEIISATEKLIDDFNSQITVKISNTDTPIIQKESYELLEIDFSAYLSRNGLSDSSNDKHSRFATISHSISTSETCLTYFPANEAVVHIEAKCIDNLFAVEVTDDFYLDDIVPNPVSRNDLAIKYGIGFECQVTISIYDATGKRVSMPVDMVQSDGDYSRSLATDHLSTGNYFLEMKAGPYKIVKKFIVE